MIFVIPPAPMDRPPKADIIDLVVSIPQIVASISQGLHAQDLLHCLQVNRDWYRLFSFELVRCPEPPAFRGVFMVQGQQTRLTIVSRSPFSKKKQIRKEIMIEIHQEGETMEFSDEVMLRFHQLGSYDPDGLAQYLARKEEEEKKKSAAALVRKEKAKRKCTYCTTACHEYFCWIHDELLQQPKNRLSFIF